MKKLDFSKQHASIVGVYEQLPSARYQQNGLFFDVNGDQIDEKEHEQENGQRHDDEQGHVDGLGNDGHGETDGESDAETGHEEKHDDEGQDEEGHVLTSDSPIMDKTDDELAALAASGMAALRAYAELFGVKGIAKQEIINELKALRK